MEEGTGEKLINLTEDLMKTEKKEGFAIAQVLSICMEAIMVNDEIDFAKWVMFYAKKKGWR